VTTTFDTLDALRAGAGTHLGWSDWIDLTADQVDRFVEATGGRPPSPAGVAPELLVLSLSNRLLPELITVPAASTGVNYGTGTIRFPRPVLVGSRIRAGAELTAVTEVAGGVQTTIVITVEADGDPGPACVVESLSRWLA
jgi:acyl dehydratase